MSERAGPRDGGRRRKPTATSAFGVGRRESHDASGFYGRFTAPVLNADSIASADRTRPNLKIQDGCHNRCSFCIIPFVRGRSRFVGADDVDINIAAFIHEAAQEAVAERQLRVLAVGGVR